MQRLGAAWIATGHYARVVRSDAGAQLYKGEDTGKDQRYFLHQVAPAALQRTLFPIGGLTKAEVRRRAHAAGLPVFDKPDSTGICVIGERPFAEFLDRHLAQSPGPIETPTGEAVGEHKGIALYTLGQRAGLCIGGRAGAAAAPWYVAAKLPERNALIVVQDPDHPLLLSDAFDVEDARWIAGDSPGDIACAVKTRHRQADLPCRIHIAGSTVRVTLDAPARSVTPGQYAVLYDGDNCLGGGVIARRWNSGAAHGHAAGADAQAGSAA